MFTPREPARRSILSEFLQTTPSEISKPPLPICRKSSKTIATRCISLFAYVKHALRICGAHATRASIVGLPDIRQTDDAHAGRHSRPSSRAQKEMHRSVSWLRRTLEILSVNAVNKSLDQSSSKSSIYR